MGPQFKPQIFSAFLVGALLSSLHDYVLSSPIHMLFFSLCDVDFFSSFTLLFSFPCVTTFFSSLCCHSLVIFTLLLSYLCCCFPLFFVTLFSSLHCCSPLLFTLLLSSPLCIVALFSCLHYCFLFLFMLLLSSPLCATTFFFTLLLSSLHSSTKFFSVVPFHVDVTPLLLFGEGPFFFSNKFFPPFFVFLHSFFFSSHVFCSSILIVFVSSLYVGLVMNFFGNKRKPFEKYFLQLCIFFCL